MKCGNGKGEWKSRRGKMGGWEGDGDIRRFILRILRPDERTLALARLRQLDGHFLEGLRPEPSKIP